MNSRALVAWNLRRLRVARGMSQDKLGADAKVDRAYVGALERQTKAVTVDVLDRLAAALSVPVGALLDEVAEGGRPQPMKPGRKPG